MCTVCKDQQTRAHEREQIRHNPTSEAAAKRGRIADQHERIMNASARTDQHTSESCPVMPADQRQTATASQRIELPSRADQQEAISKRPARGDQQEAIGETSES